MAGTVLLLEPYYAGSHKQMMDILQVELQATEHVDVVMITMPGKKWHWRARTSALYFAQNIPKMDNCKAIFTSCVLPLHELLGLRPDLQSSKKVVYFHENQLVYPVRSRKDRDFQYGYNQIMTCLSADLVLFNSKFNQDSFLANIKSFFKLQPDCRPVNLREQLEPKCQVLYFPIRICDSVLPGSGIGNTNGVLRFVWPHRWEFDKNPDMFFRVISSLVDHGKTNFRVSVLGESFTDNPPVFAEAKVRLGSYIDHFGYVSEKKEYYEILASSDIVISTADHEFFGVAMLEGVSCSCFPIAPNNLVYPEIFPYAKCLYKTEEELIKKLTGYLERPESFLQDKREFFSEFSLEKYEWRNLKEGYLDAILK